MKITERINVLKEKLEDGNWLVRCNDCNAKFSTKAWSKYKPQQCIECGSTNLKFLESFQEATKEEFDAVLKQIAQIAKDNNIQPYLVGGAIRDEVAGLSWHEDTDADLTGAEKDDGLQLAYLVARAKDLPNPTFFSGGTAALKIANVDVEFNGAKRIQNEVIKWLEANDLEVNHWNLDVYGRDFTVNALYKDLFTGKILDPTGKGSADIKGKIIRPVRDADNLILEEPARIMRAIRFKLALGAEYSPDLETSIKKHAHLLKDEVGHRGFEKQLVKIKKLSGWEDELKKFGIMEFIEGGKMKEGCKKRLERLHESFKEGIEEEWDKTPEADRRVVVRRAGFDEEVAKDKWSNLSNEQKRAFRKQWSYGFESLAQGKIGRDEYEDKIYNAQRQLSDGKISQGEYDLITSRLSERFKEQEIDTVKSSEIMDDYRNGEITKEEAKKKLRALGYLSSDVDRWFESFKEPEEKKPGITQRINELCKRKESFKEALWIVEIDGEVKARIEASSRSDAIQEWHMLKRSVKGGFKPFTIHKESLKEQDERPPKVWWDKCTTRAKSFADDPDKYCGWLWADGKKEKPALRKAFGEQLKESINSIKSVDTLVRLHERYKCAGIRKLVKNRLAEIGHVSTRIEKLKESFKEQSVWDKVLPLYKKGLTDEDIADKLDLNIDDLKDFLSKAGKKESFKEYLKLGDHVYNTKTKQSGVVASGETGEFSVELDDGDKIDVNADKVKDWIKQR